MYYVLCITMNFIKWLMNLIKAGHADVNLWVWFALLQATCQEWPQAQHTVNAFTRDDVGHRWGEPALF